MAERSLRRQVAQASLWFGAAMTMILALAALILHESVEQGIWEVLLGAELARMESGGIEPEAALRLRYWSEIEGQQLPPALSPLSVGVHDELRMDGRDFVVLVQGEAGARRAVALDISELERAELAAGAGIVIGLILVVGAMGLMVYLGSRRLVAPMERVARSIGALDPAAANAHLPAQADESSELRRIREALNDYLDRYRSFAERERAFAASASHELRTPIAVIRGAAELAVSAETSASARAAALRRILHTSREVEVLLRVLLTLAKEPGRLAEQAESTEVSGLLPALIADHQHLCEGRELALVLGPCEPCAIRAPTGLAAVAIGNLLRNAIEHSDSGEITLSCDARQVRIDDPGSELRPEAISALYARQLREGRPASEGIGLALIARLCEHLGWTLSFSAREPRGTRAVLAFACSATARGAPVAADQ